MTEPFTPAAPEDHARHDPLWMAALATRDPDLSESERTRAEAALESCGSCIDLFAELVALSAAIPSAAVPARPRDFTLTPADAERLRPRGLRRWLAGIGSVRDGITFPLALGLTTMGIAGLLVATVPAAFSGLGGAASAPAAGPELRSYAEAPSQAPEAAAPVPGASAAASATLAPMASPAAASAAPAAGQADLNATGSPDTEITGQGGVFSGDDGDAASQASQRQDAAEMAKGAPIQDDGSGVSVIVVVALTLLIAGLGLFALRWTNRRLGDG
jgi:pyruvate/2-oxoglutarate dehydrogenase complex dihydrolipoamide acyltransferase (E2) component